MKELTIEQKAQRYDEVIKKLKILHDDWATTQNRAAKEVEEIFSELKECKESEDNKIKDAAIEFVRQNKSFNYRLGISKEEVIAWLEKQGEHVKINPTEFDTRLQTLIGKFNSLPKKELIGSLSFWLNVVQNDGTYIEEKQGEHSIYNVPSREVILAIWDLGNEWKELTNGSISTEYGTQLDYIQKHWHESEYYLKEKQGEQKHVPYWMPKFLDELRSKKNYFDWDEHKDIEGGILAIIKWMNPNYFNEKDGEQKSADVEEPNYFDDFRQTDSEVEPKFKVGDKIYLKPEYRMPNDDTPIANTVFEIRAIDDKHYRFDRSYIFIEEQDKYELVEQKHAAWSEEDEKNSLDIKCLIGSYRTGDDEYRLDSWIDSLKYKAQPKQKWSKEDESHLKYVLTACKEYIKGADGEGGFLNEVESIEWLKSIKDRYAWKPSEEQLKSLQEVIDAGHFTSYPNALETLYEHLKQL